ncbi:MAG: S8 family serine peptidase [Pseudomonadota bacterium]
MRFVRVLIVFAALALAAGTGSISHAQETVRTDRSAEGATTDAAQSVEKAERKKILVMIEQAPNRLRPGASYSSGYGNAQTKAARERLGRTIAKDFGFSFVELWPMPLIGLDCFILEFTDQYTAAEAVKMVEKHPAVEWAEPMVVYETLATTRRADPLSRLSPASSAWNMSRIHSSWTGRNVTVAVIDTQVDANHPDLKGRIKVARNFAPQSPPKPEYHGTEVAGIIAANARNGIGIAGIAPGARLMALRACWQRGASRQSACTSLNLARAMNYAIERGAKIINLSLGGPPNRLLSRLINTAEERGIAVVAAYDPSRPMGGFPASHPKVIAVSQEGVTTGKGYAAPGRDIPTTQPGGGFHFVTGSSYSAAHVTGLLAINYERSRTRRGTWHALEHTDSKTRKIDIAATFE